MSQIEIATLVVSGFVLGGMTGLFGIGVGWLIAPFLMVLGYDPVTAIGSSSGYICGSALARVVQGIKKEDLAFSKGILIKKIIPWCILLLLLWFGGYWGTFLLAQIKQTSNPAARVGGELWILSSLLVFLLLISSFVFVCTFSKGITHGKDRPQSIIIQAYITFYNWCGFSRRTVSDKIKNSPGLSWKLVFALALPFGIIGFMSGIWGIGGGLFLYPILVLFFNLKPDDAASQTSLLVFINALFRSIENGFHNNLDQGIVIPLVIGGCLGVIASAFYKNWLGKDRSFKVDLAIYGLLLLIAIIFTIYKIAII